MNEFKIRCSAIGNIMSKPKKKADLISATAKTYCKKWLTEQIYNRRESISSKYLLKGTAVEDDSIKYISNALNYKKIKKNYEHFENDFFTGTPDVIVKDEILELKNSWNCFTFPLFEDDIPNKAYYYQTQGYMNLTGLKKAKLIYTLMDTPEDLIQKNYGVPIFGTGSEFYEEFKKDYIYENIDNKYRIKIFEIDYDESIIDDIRERVVNCRNYINLLLEKTNQYQLTN